MANYANNFGCKMKKPKMSLKKTKNPKFLEHLNPAKVVGDTLNFGRSVAGAQGIKLPI